MPAHLQSPVPFPPETKIVWDRLCHKRAPAHMNPEEGPSSHPEEHTGLEHLDALQWQTYPVTASIEVVKPSSCSYEDCGESQRELSLM